MTPARAIAMLDRQIGMHGEGVTLIRGAVELPVHAFVRGYRPDELVGGIEQGDVMVTISPTALAGSAFAADTPDRYDVMMIGGRRFTAQMGDPVRIAGELVRVNLQVRG